MSFRPHPGLLRLHGLSVPYDGSIMKDLRRKVLSRLKCDEGNLLSSKVVRRSVDARKGSVSLVFSVDVELRDGSRADIATAISVEPPPLPIIEPGNDPMPRRPVVVGAGPAGLFASLLLARHGYRPLILDRGGTVEQRVTAVSDFMTRREPDPEFNNLFGIGGAGTFSDGKLNTSLSHPWTGEVLRVLEECGAPEDILIDAKPHVGTDLLGATVTGLVSGIEAAGGAILTGTRMTGLKIVRGRLEGIETTDGPIDTTCLVLAIGHSARDTMRMLHSSGVTIDPKPFQMGIRVEHPQEWIDRRQFGRAAGHPALGAADYKLTARVGDMPVFSFCMCPGGQTIPTVNEPGHLCINGMSSSARDSAFGTSGIVVTLKPETHGGTNLSKCMAFVEMVESACFDAGGSDYSVPAQGLMDFARGVPTKGDLPQTSYPLGAFPARLDRVLPKFVTDPIRTALEQFDRKLPGYLHMNAVAMAPESRASSPLRITRNSETGCCIDIEGIYPVGEGAGYAGGIMSSALDGMSSARFIIERYSPPRG